MNRNSGVISAVIFAVATTACGGSSETNTNVPSQAQIQAAIERREALQARQAAAIEQAKKNSLDGNGKVFFDASAVAVRFPTHKRYYDGLSDQWCEITTKKIPASYQITLQTPDMRIAGEARGTAIPSGFQDVTENQCVPASVITKGTAAEAFVRFSQAVVQDYATGATHEQIISRGRDHYGSFHGKYSGLKL